MTLEYIGSKLTHGTGMQEKLDTGHIFPAMTLNTVAGDTVTLPDDIGTAYQVALFYRGHW